MVLSVQLVTSAVRKIPSAWSKIENLDLVVSIDGLPPEHNARRVPATYDKILRNISGHSITVHFMVTSQVAGRRNYFEELLSFWSRRTEVKKIWFSMFTPQRWACREEILSQHERKKVIRELSSLRSKFRKLDLHDNVIEGYLIPPASPSECIFALTTMTLTTDLKSRIIPCQFGGDPDCSQCGCMASAGLKAVGNYHLLGVLPVRYIFKISYQIGILYKRIIGASGH
jgi:sulfatase maturation enzyme AslB (radical SAM superfamily)